MAKKKEKITQADIINAERSIDDAKAIYVYDDSKEWSLVKLAKEFKGVSGCSVQNLRKFSSIEHWPELRRRYRGSFKFGNIEKIIDTADRKKSEQAVRNINRLELLITLLMNRFANAEEIIIKSDYDASRLLRYLIEAQTDIYDSVDPSAVSGIKGRRFIIEMAKPNEKKNSELDPLDG